jgi:hypothetical protein
MANTKLWLSPAERNLCSRRREALLYVAGRFMAVRIDYCGKRQAASYKRQAASNKLSS